MKIIDRLAFIILLSLIVTIQCVHSSYCQNKVIKLIESYLNQNSSYKIKINSINISLPFSCTLSDISIEKDGDPYIDVGSCSFTLSPHSLLKRECILNKLQLEYLLIHDTKPTDNQMSLPTFFIDYLSLNHVAYRYKENTFHFPYKVEGSLSSQKSLFTELIIDNCFILTADLQKDTGALQLKQLNQQSTNQINYIYADNKGQITGSWNKHHLKGVIYLSEQLSLLPSTIHYAHNHTGTKGLLTLQGPINDLQFKLNASCHSYKTFKEINLWAINSKGNLSFKKDDTLYSIPMIKNNEGEITTTVTLPNILEWLELDTFIGQGALNLKFNLKELLLEAHLNNGILECIPAETRFSLDTLDISCNRKELTLKRLEAHSEKSGHLKIHGSLTLDSKHLFPYSFDADLTTAPIILLDYVDILSTGKLTLKGNSTSCLVQGELTDNEIAVRIPKQLTSSSNYDRLNVTFLETNEQTPYIDKDFFPIHLDVDVKINNSLNVSGHGLLSSWSGDLNVRGTLKEPAYFGHLTLKKGTYPLLGRTINIQEGLVELNGPLKSHSQIHVMVGIDSDKYHIEAILKGQVFNPDLYFRSTPQLSEKEILARILFNRDISDITSKQALFLQESFKSIQTTTISLGAHDDNPLSKLQKNLKIDRIDLQHMEDKEYRGYKIQIGKYIFPSILLKIASDFDSRNSLGIESSIGHNLHLQAELNSPAEGQFNILWKKYY